MKKQKFTLVYEFSDGSGVALFNSESGAVMGIRHTENELLERNKKVSGLLLDDLVKQGFLEDA